MLDPDAMSEALDNAWQPAFLKMTFIEDLGLEMVGALKVFEK